jgi:release factor glutamine methyltransferase
LDRALPQIAKLLAFPHGVAYVITIDENRPLEIAQLMLEKYGIVMEPLLRRKCKNEYLTVQKMTHNLTK